MPTRRIAVDAIEEVLRMRHERGHSHREIARACGVWAGELNQLLRRADLSGLGRRYRRISTRRVFARGCTGGRPEGAGRRRNAW